MLKVKAHNTAVIVAFWSFRTMRQPLLFQKETKGAVAFIKQYSISLSYS